MQSLFNQRIFAEPVSHNDAVSPMNLSPGYQGGRGGIMTTDKPGPAHRILIIHNTASKRGCEDHDLYTGALRMIGFGYQTLGSDFRQVMNESEARPKNRD